ncbi:MAG: hypothetical protein GY820_10720 [Gammaproteobacteria bacterium]|nr:hypothetical protein [Gammaproteobacteria bacterium]
MDQKGGYRAPVQWVAKRKGPASERVRDAERNLVSDQKGPGSSLTGASGYAPFCFWGGARDDEAVCGDSEFVPPCSGQGTHGPYYVNRGPGSRGRSAPEIARNSSTVRGNYRFPSSQPRPKLQAYFAQDQETPATLQSHQRICPAAAERSALFPTSVHVNRANGKQEDLPPRDPKSSEQGILDPDRRRGPLPQFGQENDRQILNGRQVRRVLRVKWIFWAQIFIATLLVSFSSAASASETFRFCGGSCTGTLHVINYFKVPQCDSKPLEVLDTRHRKNGAPPRQCCKAHMAGVNGNRSAEFRGQNVQADSVNEVRVTFCSY